MNKAKAFWRNLFDIRPGEYARTGFMSLYLLCVLFAYYILKPVSRAMFINKFDFDDLPYLYILIAAGGGLLAFAYSKAAVKTSLKAAVTWAMSLSVLCLVAIWWLLGFRDAEGHARFAWMLYVFNVWVSLFSVVTVSQGWLVAANVFTPREAKRCYGLLGLGAVVGAAFGGEFTRRMVKVVGHANQRTLLLASAVMVAMAYVAFRLAIAQRGVSLSSAKAVEAEEADISMGGMLRDIARTRHLRVIVGIMLVTFIVDVLVEYQFQAMASMKYKKEELTAFLARFYGLWLNLVTFTFQFFLTTAVIRKLGVGGTLQIMPVSITGASITAFLLPGVWTSSAVRLTEAATRYTLNRTGMELLYLPLPLDLKNRTKAFVDIFMDRFGRGLGGLLLVLLTKSLLNLSIRQISLVVVGFTCAWIVLSLRASREYIATVRSRFESRRLDLESARVLVGDPATIRLLETTAAGPNPRQATYALGLLAEVNQFNLAPLLSKLSRGAPAEVRAKVYEIARGSGDASLLDTAMDEIRAGGEPAVLRPAAVYAVSVSPERAALARELLEHPAQAVAEGVVEALAQFPEEARAVITTEWIAAAAAAANPQRRALAAFAIGVAGDSATEALFHLLADSDPGVIAAACRAAGALRNRAYVHSILPRLGEVHVRADAIEALAQYGAPICGTLSDILEDQTLPASLRRQVPRVLKRIPHQRSVDVLLHALEQADLSVRASVLKALNRLRETAPELKFDVDYIHSRILDEARYYFELLAAMAPFRGQNHAGPKAKLLVRTIEERLRQTLERLFRLLGLRYPPKEMYSAYLAVTRSNQEEFSAALEFLDSVLERDLKRVLLPLLDAPESALERGRELFSVERLTAESAVRELIRSSDPWLAACAMAAAGELRMRALAADIAEAGKRARPEVYEVAVAAEAALA